MDNCWNRDYRDRIIRFFEPVTGPIVTEYLHNADGSVGLELLRGRADYVTFVDRGRIAKYEFNLYVRTNGRDTASRKSGPMRAENSESSPSVRSSMALSWCMQ